MRIRATITVLDEYDKFNIYIGHEGLPKKVIPLIERATKHTRKFPLFEA